jgi:hypothetical protein
MHHGAEDVHAVPERENAARRRGGRYSHNKTWGGGCVQWQASLLASWANGATAVSHPMTQAQLALLWAKLDTVGKVPSDARCREKDV